MNYKQTRIIIEDCIKPSRIYWLWFGQIVLNVLIGKFFDNMYTLLTSFKFEELDKNIYGIIG